MTSTRAGSADGGSNTGHDITARFPSLDGNSRLREHRLKVLALPTEEPLWKKKVLVGFATTAAGEVAMEDYVICERCGAEVYTRSACVHRYVPMTVIVDAEGGDR